MDEPEWQSAIQSTTVPSSEFGDRSEPVVTFWMISSCAPGLFERATNVIRISILTHRRYRKL